MDEEIEEEEFSVSSEEEEVSDTEDGVAAPEWIINDFKELRFYKRNGLYKTVVLPIGSIDHYVTNIKQQMGEEFLYYEYVFHALTHEWIPPHRFTREAINNHR